MKYYVDMPYPKVQVERKDINLAEKLLNLYAGEVSEDVSVHTYIYQMLVLEDNQDLKKIFHGIAVVEMHHLAILGLLIKELGLKPLFGGVKNQKLIWFSGKDVQYNKSIKEMLITDIKIEEETIAGYEEIMKTTTDENVIHILKRIILDERLHIEIFSKLYQQLK